MLMTQCAACGTKFQVSLSELAPSNGKVRCGTCHHVFDAQENLTSINAPVSKFPAELNQISRTNTSNQAPLSVLKPVILDASLPRYQKQRNTPIEIEEAPANSTFTKRRKSKLVGFDPKYQATTTAPPLPEPPRAFATPNSSQLDFNLPPLPQSNLYRQSLSRPGAGRDKKPLRSFTPVQIPEDAFKRKDKIAHSVFPSDMASIQPYERHPSQVANSQLPANRLNNLPTADFTNANQSTLANNSSFRESNFREPNFREPNQNQSDNQQIGKKSEHPGFKLANDLSISPLSQLEEDIKRSSNYIESNQSSSLGSNRIDPLQAPPKVRNARLTGETNLPNKSNLNLGQENQLSNQANLNLSNFVPATNTNGFANVSGSVAENSQQNQLQQEINNQALQSQLMQYFIASLNPQANSPTPTLPPTVIRQLLAQHEAFTRFQRVTQNNSSNQTLNQLSSIVTPNQANNLGAFPQFDRKTQNSIAANKLNQQVDNFSTSSTINSISNNNLVNQTINQIASQTTINPPIKLENTLIEENKVNQTDKIKTIPDFPFANVPTTSALIDQSNKRKRISTAIPADDHKQNNDSIIQNSSFLQPNDKLQLPQTTAKPKIFVEPSADLTLSSFLSEIDDGITSDASIQNLTATDLSRNSISNKLHKSEKIVFNDKDDLPPSKIVASIKENSSKKAVTSRIPSFLDEELEFPNSSTVSTTTSLQNNRLSDANVDDKQQISTTQKPIITTTVSPLVTSISTTSAPPKSIQGRVNAKVKNSATLRMGEQVLEDKSQSFLQDEDININSEAVAGLSQLKESFSVFSESKIAKAVEISPLNDEEFTREIPEPKPLPTKPPVVIEEPEQQTETPIYARPSEWETVAQLPEEANISADQDYLQRQKIEGALEEIRYNDNNKLSFLQLFSVLFLLTTLLFQIAYFYREDIVEWQPKADRIYQKLGMPALLLTNRNLIVIENSELNADANTKHLIFKARIKNTAKFRQAWPLLELSFLDEIGNPIARKVLKPDYYLAKSEKNNYFASNKIIEVNLLFDGSQIRPTGFLLTAFYP